MVPRTDSDLAHELERRLEGISFEAAITLVTTKLKQEGFGILTEIDVRDTFKKKLDVDFPRYQILGACNPQLAHRALTLEPQLGQLLPCNVVIQETGDGILVSIAAPRVMAMMVDDPALEPVVAEAEQRLRRVIRSLD
jgi:uncharacterized protein (DUF302 family)